MGGWGASRPPRPIAEVSSTGPPRVKIEWHVWGLHVFSMKDPISAKFGFPGSRGFQSIGGQTLSDN